MFVVLDGPNGSGKSSVINSLVKKNYRTLFSPGSTEFSKLLRPICRGTDEWYNVDEQTQFLAFALSRNIEYNKLVKPYTNNDIANEVVITDRWWTSSIVYQCLLGNFSLDYLKYTINKEEKIDLVIILTAPTEILIERIVSERIANAKHNYCKWTRDKKLLDDINNFYKLLPDILKQHFNIESLMIDTSVNNKEQVLNIILEKLK